MESGPIQTQKPLGDLDITMKKPIILEPLLTKSKMADTSDILDDMDHETQKQFRRVMRQVKKMSNSELTLLLSSDFDQALSSSDEQLSIDAIVERMPAVDRLLQEQEDLEEIVDQLANCNLSCEPKFARGRAKLKESLDDVQEMRRKVKSKQDKVLERIKSTQSKLVTSTRELQDKSESLADEFFSQSLRAGQDQGSHGVVTKTQEEYDNFIRNYINIKKQANLKSALVDGSMESIRRMAQNLTKPSDMDSPIPVPRQRKRVSFHGLSQ